MSSLQDIPDVELKYLTVDQQRSNLMQRLRDAEQAYFDARVNAQSFQAELETGGVDRRNMNQANLDENVRTARVQAARIAVFERELAALPVQEPAEPVESDLSPVPRS